MLDSEQSPQKKPDRCSRTSSSTSASSSLSVGGPPPRGLENTARYVVAYVEEPGHQHRVGARPRSTAIAEHLDRGDAELGQRAQQPVLAAGEPLVDGLQRVQPAVVGDEADHVAGDAALADLHQPLVLPVLERLGHGKVSSPAASSAGGLNTKRTADSTPFIRIPLSSSAVPDNALVSAGTITPVMTRATGKSILLAPRPKGVGVGEELL